VARVASEQQYRSGRPDAPVSAALSGDAVVVMRADVNPLSFTTTPAFSVVASCTFVSGSISGAEREEPAEP
jgi:hypothetical protein